MTPRELREQRKIWKAKQNKHRKEKKSVENFMENNSPPESETDVLENQGLNAVEIREPDGRKSSGKKRARKNRIKAYNEIKMYKAKYFNSKKVANKYRKRYERLLNQINTGKQIELTPKSKVNKILKKKKINDEEIRRKLVFGEVVNSSIARHYSHLQTLTEKQNFKKFLSDKIIRKYKLASMSRKLFHFRTSSKQVSNETRRKLNESKARLQVKNFLERDDNTTLSPGKKDTITRKKVKKQVRYLNDCLKSLHRKFREELNSPISYTSFCKKKPFWVVKPDVSKRDTCLCTKHHNMEMLASSMLNSKIITSPLKEIVKDLTCSRERHEKCLLRECEKCKNNSVLYGEYNSKDTINYHKWVNVKEKRIVKGIEREVKFTKKETFAVNSATAVKEFEKTILPYMKHLAAISHQYNFTKDLKENLNDEEVVLHIDFSENFACKYSSEVQSIHFGASRSQVTIHTGVAYFLNKEKDPTKFAFSTISPSMRHDPPAIWAHLQPVLKECFLQNPKIKTVHFISDSPSTQYRNKNNFYLFHSLNNMFPKVNQASWNFSEAGHGKGAPDGVGAVLKRTADQLISQGTDINSAEMFYDILSKEDLDVKMYKVSEEEVNYQDKSLKDAGEIMPIAGTMLVRQVVTTYKPQQTTDYRTLSCKKCGLKTTCSHFKVVTRKTPAKMEKKKRNKTEKDTTFEPQLWDQTQPLAVGRWVIVIYDGDWYAGVVESIDGDQITISFMGKSKDKLYWLENEDRQIVAAGGIMCQIPSAPYPVSNRHFELDKETLESVKTLFNKIMDIPNILN